MAAGAVRKKSGKRETTDRPPPYYERLEPEAFELVEPDQSGEDRVKGEVEIYDDREELGIFHIQFAVKSKRGRRVTPFHITAETARAMVDALDERIPD